MRKPTYEQLLNGEVYTTSIINEPVHYEVDFVVEVESATTRARKRWHMPEGQDDE